MTAVDLDPDALEQRASEVAGILRAIANARRLIVLCRLVQLGEATPTVLAGSVGLSQPALSQHLAKLRAEGLIAYRRDGQTLWYRIADARLERLFVTLHEVFCAPETAAGPRSDNPSPAKG